MKMIGTARAEGLKGQSTRIPLKSIAPAGGLAGRWWTWLTSWPGPPESRASGGRPL